jgi:hypothetical protein
MLVVTAVSSINTADHQRRMVADIFPEHSRVGLRLTAKPPTKAARNLGNAGAVGLFLVGPVAVPIERKIVTRSPR